MKPILCILAYAICLGMTANGLALEKNHVEESPAKDDFKTSIVSDLHFMGMPLGTDCSDLKNLKNTYDNYGNPQTISVYKEFAVGYIQLFGELISVRFTCRLGKIVQGEFSDFDKDYVERFKVMLEEKYGKENMEYGWDFGNGKTIKFTGLELNRVSIVYKDEKLQEALEKKEALKVFNENKTIF